MDTVDQLWLAQAYLRQARYDACVTLCKQLLERNRLDAAAWILMCRALTLKSWIDDLDADEETAGDALLDAHISAKNPRPGTTVPKPGTSQRGGTGRPPSGFARPGTARRPGTSRRPMTASLRPGTASVVRMATVATRSALQSDVFFRIGASDESEFVKNPACARVLCDFYLYHDQDPQKALDLCLAVRQSGNGGWWWSGRLGKCCAQLGMHSEAEKHFRASLEDQSTVAISLEVAKIFLRNNQPNGAVAVYRSTLERHPSNSDCLIGLARVYGLLDDQDQASAMFRDALQLDGSNIEALASLAAHSFHTGHYRHALTLYRRVLLMGGRSVEIWNNLGLCSHRLDRPDMALHCMTQALTLATDTDVADVWYNIGQPLHASVHLFSEVCRIGLGHVALSLGETEMAQQAWSVTVFLDNTHAEAMNNLGVMYKHLDRTPVAHAYFERARKTDTALFEPWMNGATEAMESGDISKAFRCIKRSLEINPEDPKAYRFHQELHSALVQF